MKFQAKIKKEELNGMPVASFEGEIVVIDKDSAVAAAIAELSAQQVVGIDTETKPSFNKGVHHQVALLQVATNKICYLFRLNKISSESEAEKMIFKFLGNKNVMKIGLSLKDDFSRLHRLNIGNPANFIDLQIIAKQYGILELGLQKMFAIVFNKKISKAQQLTNWENHTLSIAQQRYAATDAWAALQIYQRLTQEDKLPKPVVDRMVANALAEQQEMSRQNLLKFQAAKAT
ncbi:MAG: 3'-5' exonuclease domain-containing protein 2 [Prevotellaceae bacterium]|jgi:ribonuclease D|nr:3'-5' exonuclease domain-containing protein 2 [Prevotellaceae bacterium]